MLNNTIKNNTIKNNTIKNNTVKNNTIKTKKSKKIKILWVRHCESCSNIEKLNLKKKLSIEPLCTHNGINQSFLFGAYLSLINPYKNYKLFFYTSVLPRAMETAKIAGLGYQYYSNKNNLYKNITRLDYCIEKSNLYENINLFNNNGSQNTTTLEKSNCHMKLLNTIITNNINNKNNNNNNNNNNNKTNKNNKNNNNNIINDNIKITKKIIPKTDKTIFKSDKNDYNNFINIIIPKLMKKK